MSGQALVVSLLLDDQVVRPHLLQDTQGIENGREWVDTHAYSARVSVLSEESSRAAARKETRTAPSWGAVLISFLAASRRGLYWEP